jgi:hypothetical protein
MKFVLNKTEVEKILDVMEKFPQESGYKFDYTTSGLGYTLDMSVPTTVEGVLGEFRVNITGVENW